MDHTLCTTMKKSMQVSWNCFKFTKVKRLIQTSTEHDSQTHGGLNRSPMDQNGTNGVTAIDGTGFKVTNRGEWIRHKWDVRRGWVKVVILGDPAGNVLGVRVGNENLDERAAGRGLLRLCRSSIDTVLMDGLHDATATFSLCDKLDIQPGIKIRKNASPKGIGTRPREVRLFQELGYADWVKVKQYGLRWPASEGIFSAVKRIFGETIRSQGKRNMYREASLKFWPYQQLRAIRC